MKIYSSGAGRTFECVLHFAGYLAGYLYIASFAGTSSAVWGLSANIIEGREIVIEDESGRRIYLDTLGGQYRRIESKTGDVYHCVVLHKSAVFSENSPNPLIVAEDGDIDKAVGRYLTAKFPVPPEWEEDYYKILTYAELNMVRNPFIDVWKDLKVAKITAVNGYTNHDKLTDETLKEAITRGLKEGLLKIPESDAGGVFDPSWTMREYLKANARVLSERIKIVRPRHDPETDKLHPAIGRMERIPFPAQAHVIQGLVNTLEEQNMAVACGDMGTGKSIIALGVCNVLYEKKKGPITVLLCAPGVTIPKWEKKEIAETLPDAEVFVIRSTEDAARYLRMIREGHRPKGLEFVLVGLDRAKLGPEPWFSGIWKRVRGTKEYAWHCPDCGEPLENIYVKAKEGERPFLTWKDLACGKPPKEYRNLQPNGLPEGFIPKWKLPSKHRKCPSCGTPLWRPALKSRNETPNRPRWFVSFILKKLKKHFDLFIMDEVHQTKARDSGRGDAFAQMLKSAKKTLCLTGTLINGMSSSIKELLWRTDPKSLIREGFNHKTSTVAWAKKYGVLEKVIRSSDEDEGIVTRRKKSGDQAREKPGIAPELVVNHLLHRAAFLELGDLELPLVELKEIPVFVEMDPEHMEKYKEFHRELYNLCMSAYMSGSPGAFAKFIPSTINYADRPDLGAEVAVKDRGKKVLGVVYAPAFPDDYYHAKERELVCLVRENLAEDRGVVIYCNYTDSYGVHHRLKEVLETHGIEAHVLESHVSPEKRVEWLAQKEEEGAKVIICNMRLVEVGLDLLPWPTIIFYQMNYDINTVRQASRRAWRIGQTRECRVYYLVYESTQQAAQFEYCMIKRAHAMLAEGRLDRSELAKFGRDLTSSLAADIAGCLAGEEVAEKWKELAERDLDEKLELVEESKFLEILSKTQKKLARRTLELCGLPVDEIEETEEEVKRPTILELAAFLPKRRRKRAPRAPKGYRQLSFEDLLFGAGM
ncbi:DEAD-like helicase [Desulfofundulus kuznetsovii DSM 6115]|uniref:DEAD-like helicase n=1 Tax=Desulfofundulus kuznetsovii (strain DSM 6115 / VKM B-1805 / 17) TaxID=760568 RepID=A0AAU8PUK8_DESK7|nr:DEAD-like helicase [Desulfofundulus kuznetsovii DSM 6115]